MTESLKVLIVDDEELARVRLGSLLEELPGVDVVGEAVNGMDAVEKVLSLRPDVVLLDIQMPGMNGFEVIEALDEVPLVIFATAFDEYAIKAFEVNSIDYLLKPVSRERLEQAIARARDVLGDEPELGAEIERLTALARARGIERLPVSRGKKIILLSLPDIIWISSEEGLVFAHTAGGKFLVNMTMGELEERLDPGTFFRAHRSTIVNLGRVKEIVPWFSGKYRVVMDDEPGTELTLSRSRAKALREILPW
ncbi:MAG: LytTR family DNA-binding domain-containing protein [Candidatus Eisenbacteria bacterium]